MSPTVGYIPMKYRHTGHVISYGHMATDPSERVQKVVAEAARTSEDFFANGSSSVCLLCVGVGCKTNGKLGHQRGIDCLNVSIIATKSCSHPALQLHRALSLPFYPRYISLKYKISPWSTNFSRFQHKFYVWPATLSTINQNELHEA